MAKNILGINMSCLDTSACVMKDGELSFAVREERLTREKRTRRFPMLAIGAAMDHTGLSMGDIDEIGVSWNPAINLERHTEIQSAMTRYKPEHYYSVPSYLFSLCGGRVCTDSSQSFAMESGERLRIRYLSHHLCHAAGSFYLSGFDEAVVAVMDAYGEKDSFSLYHARGNKFTKVQSIFFPNSLGSFYGTITQFLGFTPDSDEWKVMGASSYGDPERYGRKLLDLFRINSDGTFEIDQSYFYYPLFSRPTMYSPQLIDVLGPPRREDEELGQRHYDIAAGTQFAIEKVVFDLLRKAHEACPLPNLCLSGGVAMNCVMNGKVLRNTPFERLFISSAPDDGGTSVGAALYLNHEDGTMPRLSYRNNYWGPCTNDEKIRAALDTYRVRYEVLDDPALTAARLISEGKIIAWFQGRMEFGERALGNRSIIADPRDASMKDRINRAVKFREGFRPFAPSIIEEHVHEYFEDAQPSPFMEKVFMIRPEKRSVIGAVTHIDGTGRLQTLGCEQNPLYYRVIEEFKKITGIPLILNTSFNLKGEPIVTHPDHALRTFFTSGMDGLIMHNCLVIKTSY